MNKEISHNKQVLEKQNIVLLKMDGLIILKRFFHEQHISIAFCPTNTFYLVLSLRTFYYLFYFSPKFKIFNIFSFFIFKILKTLFHRLHFQFF